VHCPSAQPAALLWDMDGTLVDTEAYWMAAEYELVESFGGVWSHEHAMAVVGRALTGTAAYIIEHGKVPLGVDEVVGALLASVGRRLREHVPWRPGALELLAEARAAGVPSALVTMSYRSLTDLLLEAMPTELLAVVVAGDDVTHGKPHPEPYLAAATRLGVAPEACIAVEDSLFGAQSATAAGVPTIVVSNVKPVAPMAGSVQLPTLAGVGVAELVAATAGLRQARLRRA
jgi:HAD superfamily hydrolase (TIGR01509 family)